MNEPRTNDPGPKTPWLPIAGLVVVALMVAAGALGTGWWLARNEQATGSPIAPTATVVTAIRDLARLEGAEFHIERVIDLQDKQSRLFGLIETNDAILLVASGSVIAGVDLKELDHDDIEVDSERRHVTLRLPRARILTSRLDNERTYVHSRDTDLLAKRRSNLEAEARLAAEKSIIEAAERQNITLRAQKNVERTLRALLTSLGYVRIDIEFD